jgi:hypothetical protein
MDKSLIDRWTDTAAFRFVLFFAGIFVMPVLAMGVLTTVIGGAFLVAEPSAVELGQVVFGLLSAGGALGVVGYARAHVGARNPDRHNVGVTLLCLAAGIVTALVVAGYVVLATLEDLGTPWGPSAWASLTTLFAAANLVWALSGIDWMQRLSRRHAERTGLAFDGVPALLLFVAVALATAAATIATTL